MRSPIYILETSRGGRAITFDSLDRARAEVARRIAKDGTRFRIIEQTITEREIAA